MNQINNTLSTLEFAQIGWVVPDIHRAIKFLSATLGIKSFPEVAHLRAQDLGMSYRGEIVEADWLTTQTFHGGTFIELVQPLGGQSMFHDYLQRCPTGGTQHLAFRLPIADFERVCAEISALGHERISEVNHPIAHMAFFDTYDVHGVVTEIMGVTDAGWMAIESMKKS